MKTRRAFTLMELMVVLAVIAILASLLLPVLAGAKRRAVKTYCRNNLRQMCIGSEMYSEDDSRGWLTGSLKPNTAAALADSDVNWLFPKYIPTVNVFICPSTQNYIRSNTYIYTPDNGGPPLIKVRDLDHWAKSNTAPGTSYKVFGLWHSKINGKLTYPRKTKKTITTFAHQNNAFGLKGTIAGPSATWLFLDKVKASKVYPQNNYPNPLDNHGQEGDNVGFCDGHVEWVSQKDYVYKYELSEDQGRTQP